MSEKNLNKNTMFTIVLLPLLLSALWEKVLSPLFDKCLGALLSFTNVISATLSNFIYSEISMGYMDYSSPLTNGILLGTYFGIFVFILIFSIKGKTFILSLKNMLYFFKKDSPQNVTKPKKRFLILSSIYSIFCMAIILLIVIGIQYIQTESVRLTNNIEIVSPYVSDIEYKQLKSSFHSMDSRSDYDELNSQLEKIASMNDLELK